MREGGVATMKRRASFRDKHRPEELVAPRSTSSFDDRHPSPADTRTARESGHLNAKQRVKCLQGTNENDIHMNEPINQIKSAQS